MTTTNRNITVETYAHGSRIVWMGGDSIGWIEDGKFVPTNRHVPLSVDDLQVIVSEMAGSNTPNHPEVTITREACERALEACELYKLRLEAFVRIVESAGVESKTMKAEQIANLRTTITALRKALEDSGGR